MRKNCFLMEGEPGGRSDATSGLTPRNGRARKGDQPLFAASHRLSLLFSTTFLNNPASYRAVQQRIRRVSTRSLQIHRRLRRPTEPSFPSHDLDLSHSAVYFSRWNASMEPRSLPTRFLPRLLPLPPRVRTGRASSTLCVENR